MAEVFVFERPAITVKPVGGAAGTEIDVECFAREVGLFPEDTETDIETFCQIGATRPGKTTWTAEILALQSFGADGLWTLLSPLSRQLCNWTILPDGGVAVSVDNPAATFDAYMPTIPFLNRAPIGEPSEIELAPITVVGAPTFGITPPAGTTTAADDPRTVAELQAELTERGLPTSGTKSELLERLAGE